MLIRSTEEVGILVNLNTRKYFVGKLSGFFTDKINYIYVAQNKRIEFVPSIFPSTWNRTILRD